MSKQSMAAQALCYIYAYFEDAHHWTWKRGGIVQLTMLKLYAKFQSTLSSRSRYIFERNFRDRRTYASKDRQGYIIMLLSPECRSLKILCFSLHGENKFGSENYKKNYILYFYTLVICKNVSPVKDSDNFFFFSLIFCESTDLVKKV